MALLKEQGLLGMLVRMVPEQVSENWEFFAPMFAKSFPQELGVTRTLLTNMLAAVLRDDLVVWLDYDEGDKEEGPTAMVATKIREDEVMCIRSLLVHNLYVLRHKPIKYWKENLRTLQEFARVHKCSNIVGYAWDPIYIRFLKQLGANTDTVVAVL